MRDLGDIFRRDRAADPEQWEAGDIAECIYAGPWFRRGFGLVAGPCLGDRYVVSSIYEATFPKLGRVVLLKFGTFPGGYQADGFRKVTPRRDALEQSTASRAKDPRPAPTPRELEPA